MQSLRSWSRRALGSLLVSIAAASAGLVGCAAPAGPGAGDPLPSWQDTAARRAIVQFVADVTRAGGPNYVPPAERIAVFDNDGTLWSEQPLYFQFIFLLDRVKAEAPRHPEWRSNPAFQALAAGDHAAALRDEKALMELLAAVGSGLTTDEQDRATRDWLATARHPKFNRPYTDLVYQPQLELLAYLRAHGFKTFIVSGGSLDFMRPWAEKAYGIPPEQVVGSFTPVKPESRDGRPTLVRQAGLEINDGPTKPVGIYRHIGRRPLLAFGNSDGDLQMLQYTVDGPGPRLALLLHHDDAAREFAYDRQSPIGRLDKAWDEARAKGWTVVSMNTDWRTVYPSSK